MQKGKPYILLVEDDPDDQYTFCEAFGRLNPDAAIEVVSDGKRLLEFLDACTVNDPPALILLDYKMPVVSGPEVLRELACRPAFSAIPVFVWSTSNRIKDITECKRLGALDYFKKPSTCDEVDELIRYIAHKYTS